MIPSAVMAGILIRSFLPRVLLVVFDTSVVDLSVHVDDPVEVLMSVQLGRRDRHRRCASVLRKFNHHPRTAPSSFSFIDFGGGASPSFCWRQQSVCARRACACSGSPRSTKRRTRHTTCEWGRFGGDRDGDRRADAAEGSRMVGESDLVKILRAQFARLDDATLEQSPVATFCDASAKGLRSGRARRTQRPPGRGSKLRVADTIVTFTEAGLARLHALPVSGVCRHMLVAVFWLTADEGEGRELPSA